MLRAGRGSGRGCGGATAAGGHPLRARGECVPGGPAEPLLLGSAAALARKASFDMNGVQGTPGRLPACKRSCSQLIRCRLGSLVFNAVWGSEAQ